MDIIQDAPRESFISASVSSIGQQYFSRLAPQSLTVFCRDMKIYIRVDDCQKL